MTTLPPTPGPAEPRQPDHFEVEVIRSEERLSAATTRHVTSRIRVGKRIVTEERTITVTLRREEFYLQELPVDAALPADSAPIGADREVVMTLSAEEPVVTTQVAPLERVTVRVVTLTEDAITTADVAREVIEVDRI